MSASRRLRAASAVLAIAGVAARPDTAHAQHANRGDSAATVPDLRLPEPDGRVAWPTDAWDERRRLQGLLRDAAPYPLLRSTQPTDRIAPPSGWRTVTPRVAFDWSGADPSGGNDGGLWSGRGASARVVAGLRAQRGRLRFDLLPEAWATQNAAWSLPQAPFPVPTTPPGFSPFASPWNLSTDNARRYPIDLPWRFGDRALARVTPGESGLWADLDALSVGLTTDHEWWGPSRRNPLVLGTNAEGIPRLALRSRAPLDVPGGALAFSYGVGVLQESPYFDDDPANDRRSWSGLALEWHARAARGLTLGAARGTIGPVAALDALGGRVLDVLRLGVDGGAPRATVASLFVRYAPSGAGIEVYAEAGRTDAPASLRDALLEPTHSMAYTLGLQRVLPREAGAWQLTGEATIAEQRASYRLRPVGSWYSSRAVPQGYTHRGQVIAAPIGPGGSAQFVAVDYLARTWQLGGYASRTRANQDAFFAQSRFAPVDVLGFRNSGWSEFDVAIELGMRGIRRTTAGLVEGSIGWRHRYNPYWRNLAEGPAAPRAEDASGLVLRLAFVPMPINADVATPHTPAGPDVARGDAPRANAPRLADLEEYLAERSEWFADADGERYARLQQLLGERPMTTWSMRALPDAARTAGDAASSDGVRRLRSRVGVSYNTGVPWGFNDGAVWQGRGATIAASGGFTLDAGPLHVVVAPTVFRAENRAFDTFDGQRDCAALPDPQYPTTVDVPQRFGCAAYARLDPGQSELRLEGFGLRAGLSSANQWWGPATTFPFLLSTNAAGVPRLFLGTTRGIGTPIGRFHGEVHWGRLEQSDWFTPTGIARARRFGAGVVGVFKPAFLPGLEVGGGRYFHAPWPSGEIPARFWTRPVLPFLKDRITAQNGAIPSDPTSVDGENQLASAFARWGIPAATFEMYAEFGREDNSADVRDLLVDPDQQSALMVGFQKAWIGASSARWIVRGEALDHRMRSIDRFRGGASIYTHASGSNQGHTVLGQLLGAATGPGSASGAVAGVDRWDASGRLSVHLMRIVRRQRFVTALPITRDDRGLDVAYAVDLERRLLQSGRDLTAGAALIWNANRDFRQDVTNAQFRLAWRF